MKLFKVIMIITGDLAERIICRRHKFIDPFPFLRDVIMDDPLSISEYFLIGINYFQDDSTFTITVDGKTFHFQAQDSEERERWIR